jgi:hypothetical protein
MKTVFGCGFISNKVSLFSYCSKKCLIGNFEVFKRSLFDGYIYSGELETLFIMHFSLKILVSIGCFSFSL